MMQLSFLDDLLDTATSVPDGKADMLDAECLRANISAGELHPLVVGCYREWYWRNRRPRDYTPVSNRFVVDGEQRYEVTPLAVVAVLFGIVVYTFVELQRLITGESDEPPADAETAADLEWARTEAGRLYLALLRSGRPLDRRDAFAMVTAYVVQRMVDWAGTEATFESPLIDRSIVPSLEGYERAVAEETLPPHIALGGRFVAGQPFTLLPPDVVAIVDQALDFEWWLWATTRSGVHGQGNEWCDPLGTFYERYVV